MNHQQKELMLYLADRLDDLEKIPATMRPEFDMRNWRGERRDGIRCEGDCDTAVCAMGLAAMDPRFRAAGLRMMPASLTSPTGATGFVTFGDYHGFSGVAMLFGISFQQAVHAFSQDSYAIHPRPSEVAARLRTTVGACLP